MALSLKNTLKVKAWMSDYIPQKTIGYDYWSMLDLRYTMSVKEANETCFSDSIRLKNVSTPQFVNKILSVLEFPLWKYNSFKHRNSHCVVKKIIRSYHLLRNSLLMRQHFYIKSDHCLLIAIINQCLLQLVVYGILWGFSDFHLFVSWFLPLMSMTGLINTGFGP